MGDGDRGMDADNPRRAFNEWAARIQLSSISACSGSFSSASKASVRTLVCSSASI
jgi:hypothetical protein